MAMGASTDVGWIPFGGPPCLTRVLGYWGQVLAMTGTTLIGSPSEGLADSLGESSALCLGVPFFLTLAYRGSRDQMRLGPGLMSSDRSSHHGLLRAR